MPTRLSERRRHRHLRICGSTVTGELPWRNLKARSPSSSRTPVKSPAGRKWSLETKQGFGPRNRGLALDCCGGIPRRSANGAGKRTPLPKQQLRRHGEGILGAAQALAREAKFIPVVTSPLFSVTETGVRPAHLEAGFPKEFEQAAFGAVDEQLDDLPFRPDCWGASLEPRVHMWQRELHPSRRFGRNAAVRDFNRS